MQLSISMTLLKLRGTDPVTPELLKQNGLINDMKDGLKVLGMGELKAETYRTGAQIQQERRG